MMSLYDLPAIRRRKGERTVRRALSASRRKVDELPVAEWGEGDLAALRDEEPQPEFDSVPARDPLRDTGPIPGLAEAQQALKDEAAAAAVDTRPVNERTLQRVADALRNMDATKGAPQGSHPFDTAVRTEAQRVREDTPEPTIRPLPPRLPKTPRPPQAWAVEHLNALTYPAVAGGTSPSNYRTVMRVIDGLTGTRSRLTWAPEIESGRAA